MDNKTAHKSTEYDAQVRSTIPYYECFHEAAISLVRALGKEPSVWLDTGCGTGTFVQKTLEAFPNTKFLLADPSEEMLSEAKRKLSSYYDNRVCYLNPAPSENLEHLEGEKPEVITAIQAHHYLSKDGRMKATKACYELLKENGLFITFENIRPFTEEGIEAGLTNWRNFQVLAGKTPENALKHSKRFGVEYFPITIEEHLAMLRNCGFRVVEMLWYSYMQAGFYCIK